MTTPQTHTGTGLSVQGLALDRGGRRLVEDVAFHAAAGEALIVRGPNGIGKSTLLRTLAGLLPLRVGQVRLDHGQLGAVNLADRAAFSEQVAYAGHLDAIKPALTVMRNIQTWAGLFGADPARAGAALERFGLMGLAERPAAQCSAGQKRRLGLARLLVTDRPLWLLDEPTVSLDRDSTAVVADMIAQHQATGGIAVIATHIDLGLAVARGLDLAPFKAEPARGADQADAFLQGTWT